ncbi:MAG: hypothetical protein ACKODX_19470 [Gemmata sp.]
MMTRLLCFGLLAAALVVAKAPPARADLPGPHPRPQRPLRPPPEPAPVPNDPGVNVLPAEQQPPPPVTPRPSTGDAKRAGPFRSCGSGIGTGLAGIGVAWGMLWLGTRASRYVRRS